MPTIKGSEQVGYTKNRDIGINIRTIFDILSYCDINKIEAYIAQLDSEKAHLIVWSGTFYSRH